MKTAEKVNVTVQITPDLLAKVDLRAVALDLNRSQYFRRLIKRDVEAPLKVEEQLELAKTETPELELAGNHHHKQAA